MRLIFTFLLMCVAMVLFGQKQVRVIFDHEVDGIDLNFGQNYNHPYGMFSIHRLQYYLSNISIVHDGAQETTFKGHYVLVNGNQTTYDIGVASINSIEGIKWNIGVDSTMNHSDPAFWPEGHPLAYQNPSTHWGWVSGYRFLCFEGLFDYNSDNVPEKIWEFHAVGDALLTPISLAIQAAETVGDTINIYIKADYSKLFIGVHIDNILHGAGSKVTKMMSNFVTAPVFSESSAPTSVDNPQTVQNYFTLLGNPSAESASIQMHPAAGPDAELFLLDLNGHQRGYWTNTSSGRIETPSLPSGLYILGLRKNSKWVQVQQCVITNPLTK